MPSRKSKRTRRARPPSRPPSAGGRASRSARPASQSSRRSAWKDERACSETRLGELAGELARRLRPGDVVLLEGPLGAGKTTFSRFILLALGVEQPPEGSPTFAIAHEYLLGLPPRRRVVHVDLYRVGSEAELEERGLTDFFWDPESVVLAEWVSRFPALGDRITRKGRGWRVELDFSEEGDEFRSVRLRPLSSMMPAR